MKNLDKYLTLLDGEVDGLLLTSRYSRHYGAEFDIAEGVAIVTKKGCRYFTDSRYIESAEKNLKGFEVLDVNREIGYIQRLNTAIADFGVTTLGYEEHYLTAEEYFHYDEKLNAKLVPFHKPIYAFRATKEDWELELMRKAQALRYWSRKSSHGYPLIVPFSDISKTIITAIVSQQTPGVIKNRHISAH